MIFQIYNLAIKFYSIKTYSNDLFYSKKIVPKVSTTFTLLSSFIPNISYEVHSLSSYFAKIGIQ